ncbi:MAG: DUF4097 domain-containing protein [Coriobacteriales bacterium]|jgi:hypothetical protein|nr:DUF4097 domain-containing protein [Coriobacteriales bacterium]
MKRTTKILLIVAVGLILVGGILGTIGYALGGLKAVNLTSQGVIVASDEGGVLASVDEQWDEITGLDINLDVLDLELVPGDTFKLTGSYDSRLMDLRVSEDDGVLTVRSTYRERWGFGLFGIHETDLGPGLTLTYPRGTKFEQVSVSGDFGELRVEGLDARSLKTELSAGSFTGRDITVQELEVDLDAGSAELDGLEVVDSARMLMSAGRLDLKDSTVENLSATCNMGDFDFSGTLSGRADIKMNLGDLDMRLDVAERDMAYSIESSMGSATLNGRNARSSTQSDASSPKLTLDVSLDMGSADIRTK